MATQAGPISGQPSSPGLKARIVDFMERADELLSHELAGYNPPFTLTVMAQPSTGEVFGYKLDHRILPKEQLVYVAVMERPILWTESEPIYITKLLAALGQDHEQLRPDCPELGDAFKRWRNRLFIGAQSSSIRATDPPIDGWRLTGVSIAPPGTPLPEDDRFDKPIVDDMYYAKIYLNGFVWHNDIDKTAEYRAASELEQLHYRKCAEIRVFSGLHQVIEPVHQFILDARTAGADF